MNGGLRARVTREGGFEAVAAFIRALVSSSPASCPSSTLVRRLVLLAGGSSAAGASSVVVVFRVLRRVGGGCSCVAVAAALRLGGIRLRRWPESRRTEEDGRVGSDKPGFRDGELAAATGAKSHA